MSRLESLLAQTGDIADLFRLGRDVEAALAMIELFDPLQSLVAGRSLLIQQEWAGLLSLMLQCQERQNWLGLADYLDFELVSWLRTAFAD